MDILKWYYTSFSIERLLMLTIQTISEEYWKLSAVAIIPWMGVVEDWLRTKCLWTLSIVGKATCD